MTSDGGHIIGIDLGTTFSAMSYLDPHGTPITIPNAEGELTTPSVVLFDPSGDVIVGREARRACQVYPDRVAVCIKREMGEKLCSHLIAGKRLTPPSVAALILKKLKQDAENRIGPVHGAVITVPAHFDDVRRRATADAGTIAGLTVLDLLNEPTSAALAYAFKRFVDRGGRGQDIGTAAVAATDTTTALVYDLGGGTFDVTIIHMSGNDIRVLATDGDVRLGGKDWDDRVVNYAAELFMSQHGSDPRQDPQSYQDLLLTAEEAKKGLSRRMVASFAVNHAGKRLVVRLERPQFEEMTADLLYRSENRVDRVVRQAKLTWAQVDEVLLVGGSSRMPQVSNMLRRITGREPNGTLSVDEVVAHGAAIHGAIQQVAAGNKSEPEIVLFEDETGADPQQMVELEVVPEEAAAEPVAEAVLEPWEDAVGPEELNTDALMAFDEDITELLQTVNTVNVNAHSLGIIVTSHRTGKDYNSIIIPRNTPLPASRKNIYGTIRQNQPMVVVRVVEGEAEDPDACLQIGQCVVAPLPAGLPIKSPISVTFTYDSSGRLHVRAKDETSGLTAKATIVRQSVMTPQELQKARQIVESITIA